MEKSSRVLIENTKSIVKYDAENDDSHLSIQFSLSYDRFLAFIFWNFQNSNFLQKNRRIPCGCVLMQAPPPFPLSLFCRLPSPRNRAAQKCFILSKFVVLFCRLSNVQFFVFIICVLCLKPRFMTSKLVYTTFEILN